MVAWSSSSKLKSAGLQHVLFSSPSPLFPLARCRPAAMGHACAGVYARFPARAAPFSRALPLPSHARRSLTLPARKMPAFSPARAKGPAARLLFSPRGPALDLGGRLGVHPTPWRRLSAQGDAIRRNGVAGRTPPLGSRLDALASPRRRRENHGKDIHQLLHNILSMILFLSTL